MAQVRVGDPGGYPNAATGDLQTFALPISIGEADSAVFTVVQ